jgi:WD40 repeat protein
MADQGAHREGPPVVEGGNGPATPGRSVTLDDAIPTRGQVLTAPTAPNAEKERVVDPGEYDILREYARGGLGRILEARDTRLDRIVAIKELQRDHPIARARFSREVRVTARLQHPNIVPIHEAGRWPSGASFYSMKLVEGKTLSQAVADRHSLVERSALLPAVVDVARAIAYAHSQHIIHRDLKPANVLVGPFGETVVIDWGLAKHLNDDTAEEDTSDGLETDDGAFSTRLGAVVGTPAFMPPEQAAGEPVDERADVYALGAMLYFVVSGRSPYDDVPQGDVLDRVVDSPPSPHEDLAPDVPPDLLAIVHKCMARDANDRYPGAQALLDELERFAAGRLVDAYRYRASDLIARFVRRHRAAVLTAVLGLVVVITIAALFVVELTEQRDRAHRSAVSEGRAREVAERRVDELLVVKARSLLDSDPTLAVAWLKKLREIPEGAATVAARAEDRGVARRVLRGHRDLVTSVAVTRDGRHAASGGHDRNVRVWDLATGESIVLSSHTERITEVLFSPTGSVLASAAYDGSVRLYDVTSKAERELVRMGAPVKAIAFTPDGDRLAAAAADGGIVIAGPDGRVQSKFKAAFDRDVFVSFSNDGGWLMTGSHRATVRLWDLDGNAHKSLEGHVAPIVSAAIAPDARTVVTAGEDGVVLLFDLVNDTSERLHENPMAMRATAFSPDSLSVAAAGQDGAVRLWNVADRRSTVVTTHGERVERLLFAPDGRRLVSAGWDKVVRVTDLRTNASRAFLGHADVVSSVAFSGASDLLVTGSWDKAVRVWPLDTRPTERSFRGHGVGVHAVAVSRDGTWIASGGHDDTVRLWRTDGSDQRVFTGHRDHVYRVAFSPDGRLLASSSDDQTVRLWSVPGGRETVLSGHRADVEELAFSPDGRLLASAGEDDAALLWSIPAGGPPIRLPHEHDVTSLAFSPGGERLATASRDHLVRTWAMPGGELLETLREHTDEVRAVAFSPDGSALASASSDGTVVVRPTLGGQARVMTGLLGARALAFNSDGTRLAVAGVAPRAWACVIAQGSCKELLGHRALIRDLVFAPGRDLLVTASGDATVQIWNLTTGERRILEGHVAPVFDLEMFPDGTYVVSGGGDAVVQMWPIREPPDRETLRGFLDGLTTEVVDEPPLGASP